VRACRPSPDDRMPRVPNPIGLPSELIGALKLLPTIAERLGEVVQALSVLSEVSDGVRRIGADTGELRSVSSDTECLPAISEKIGVVAQATDTLPTLDQRMSTIEAAMPALLEVQQHLALLPESIERLDGHIGRLAAIMDDLLGSMRRLDDDMNILSASVEPLGRLADRMPGGKR
jgi:DNA repair ATPase RecN